MLPFRTFQTGTYGLIIHAYPSPRVRFLFRSHSFRQKYRVADPFSQGSTKFPSCYERCLRYLKRVNLAVAAIIKLTTKRAKVSPEGQILLTTDTSTNTRRVPWRSITSAKPSRAFRLTSREGKGHASYSERVTTCRILPLPSSMNVFHFLTNK